MNSLHETPRPSSEHLPKEGHRTVQARSLLAPMTSGVPLLMSKHHSPVVKRRQMNACPPHPVPGAPSNCDPLSSHQV